MHRIIGFALFAVLLIAVTRRTATQKSTSSATSPDPSWDSDPATTAPRRRPGPPGGAIRRPVPVSVQLVRDSLGRFEFQATERRCRELLASPGLDPAERTWLAYYAAEALWSQGKLDLAKPFYLEITRKSPDHAAARNATAALEYIANLRGNQELLARHREGHQ